MPNVTISELPDAVLPLDGPNSFFEVQTTESGVVVSRKVASDNISITADLPLGTLGQTIYNSDGSRGYTATDGLTIDPNGEVQLTWNAAASADITFRLTTDGAILRRPSAPTPNDLRLLFTEGTFIEVTMASIGFDGSDIFTINGLGLQTDINTNSSGGVTISQVGIPVFQTLATSVKVLNARFDVDNDGLDTLTSSRVRNLTGGVDLRILTGGDAAISQLVGTTGGFEDDWLEFARNLGVTINHNNISMARSVAIGSGGFEVNNTVTGAGFERVLTVSDLGGGVGFPIQALDNDQIQWGTGNDVQQFFNGTDLLFTAVAGVDFRFSSASTALLELVGTGLNLDATLGTRADSGGVAWYWDESVTTGKIRQTSAAGVLEDDWITMVINGAVALFFNGVNVAQTMAAASGGLQVNNTLTGAGFERVLTIGDLFTLADPLTIGQIIISNTNLIDLVDTNTALNIGSSDPDNNPHVELGLFGLGAGIQAKATATTIDTLEIQPLGGTLNLGPPGSAAVAGGANLRFANGGGAGGNIVETTISGIILEGRTGSNTILDFHQVNGNLAMRVVHNGGNFQFEGFINSQEIRFQSRDSGSTVRQLLHLDPDDDIAMFDQGTEVAHTLPAASGGFAANNTLTGAGFERVLTTSDLGAGDPSGWDYVAELLTDTSVVTSTTLVEITDFTVDDTIYPTDLSGTEKYLCRYYVDGFVSGGAGGGARLGHRYINSAHIVEARGLHRLMLDTTSSVAHAAATEEARGDIGTSATATAFTLNNGVSGAQYTLRSQFSLTSNTQSGDEFTLEIAQQSSDAQPTIFERAGFVKFHFGTLVAV